MKKAVYVINENGFITSLCVIELDEKGYPTEELAENNILVKPPNGLFRARWTGTEWIEDMPQSEIDELNKPVDRPLSDVEILGQQMTERELEASAQGQQLTDMDLRLYEMEVSKNV